MPRELKGLVDKVRIRVDDNIDDLGGFLLFRGYPSSPDYDYIASDACIRVRLFIDGFGTVGWVWASWSDHRTLSVHACCEPGVLYAASADLFKLAEYLGAECLVVTPPDGNLGKLLPIFCRRLGFEAREDGLYKELTNG